MQCARLGSFPGTVGPGGPQMGDRSELAVWGDGFGVYKLNSFLLGSLQGRPSAACGGSGLSSRLGTMLCQLGGMWARTRSSRGREVAC